MRLFLAVLCAGVMVPLAARSANVKPAMREAAAEILRAGAPGVSMAVVANGRTFYCNAGTSGRPRLPVTNRTLFETASISKVFTTTLLGIDVARGQKSLDDPIGQYMRGYSLRPHMRRATLEMLGTFTAGLPNMPADYVRLSAAERGIGNYTVPHFLRYVSRLEPPSRPPALRVYSDASVGLLGLCLGNLKLGIWERRLRAEIFDPLDMRDTGLWLSAGQENRLARGYERAGHPAPRWKVDAFAAADGIKSTTFDLAQFLTAQLGKNESTPEDLKTGMAIAVRTGFLVHFSHAREFQALAWRQDPVLIGRRNFWIVTKSGGVPGFSSNISFCRDLDVGVAILANVSGLDLRDIEFNLIKSIARAR